VMGHKSIRTTERYAHLQRHVGDRARAALERGVDRG
jgi:site-specific recombinase XerD